MRSFLFACVLFISALPSFAQGTEPVDQRNEALLSAQLVTANNFMRALEKNQPEKALALIDTAYAKSKPSYKDSLMSFIRELSKYRDTTVLSVVIVWPEPQFNTYRCRYYNEHGEFFYIDLFLSTGKPFSLIQRIVKTPEAELEKDRRELAKYLKEHQNDAGPDALPDQSPPPPPAKAHH